MIPFLRDTGLRSATIAALVLLAAASFAESSVLAAPGRRAKQPATQQSSGAESSLPVFELHSGFWVNLHHFLYLQARMMNGNSSSIDTGRGAAPPDDAPISLSDFPPEEIKAWLAAVAFYAKDLGRRDLLLNGEMETINNRLSEMEACADLQGKNSAACKSGLQPDLVETLDRAAPVYRAHWWAEQDRANREWIAHDARNRGIYGFEVLFHEASHALAGAVNEAIAREFRQRDKPIPRDLWHALLFYTTGELVRRDLAYGTMTIAGLQGTDPSSYQPYAARFGLYSGAWDRFRGMLDLYWRPYLDGKVSFDTAVARLAAAL